MHEAGGEAEAVLDQVAVHRRPSTRVFHKYGYHSRPMSVPVWRVSGESAEAGGRGSALAGGNGGGDEGSEREEEEGRANGEDDGEDDEELSYDFNVPGEPSPPSRPHTEARRAPRLPTRLGCPALRRCGTANGVGVAGE